jgi:hypothetical protein
MVMETLFVLICLLLVSAGIGEIVWRLGEIIVGGRIAGLWLPRPIARRIVLYRPQYLMGLERCADGYTPRYELGDLRARLFGVRVPIHWALDQQHRAGCLK